MRRFRSPDGRALLGATTDLLAVGQLIDDAMQPGHFFAAPDLRLTWIAARAETIAWEIFRGRLLDPAHTRATRSFLAWHVIQQEDTHAPTAPMLSVKLDVSARQIHVVRGLLGYLWEGHGSGNVVESRETIRWTRELVGTIALESCADLESLRDELICVIWQAIVGTSRLPLHSVEAPLPAFLFGQLHYVQRDEVPERAAESWEDFLGASLRAPLAWSEQVKLVEFVLRAVQATELPLLAERLVGIANPRLLRSLFNDVSLSPYTSFVENALALLDLLTERGTINVAERIDFLSWLLRQLGRHLTAFDLVTFHHRGANYPDAILLDAALRVYVRELERTPAAFLADDPPARRRRRALRQACLLRRHYEGHLVPDVPTSPGENARVLPASHPRVPEEQLTQTLRRRRQLYADEPLTRLLGENARRALRLSVFDLNHAEERSELGLGVFIDRPLGYAKATGETDQTPLLAHEAFSPSIARRRAKALRDLCDELELTVEVPGGLEVEQIGIPHRDLAECPRPAAALADVRKVADDFVIVRTLPGGLTVFTEQIDWQPLLERYRLAFLRTGIIRFVLQTRDMKGAAFLAVYDGRLRRRLELRVDDSRGFSIRAGVELPMAGLRVVRLWEDAVENDALILREAVDCVLLFGSRG